MRLHHEGSIATWHACLQMILVKLNSRRTRCQRRGGRRWHIGRQWLEQGLIILNASNKRLPFPWQAVGLKSVA